jgi:hypothetical protein
VQYHETGSYNVTLIAHNANGQAHLTKNNYVMIGGMPLPYSEDFENGSLTDAYWTVENPDLNITWELTEVSGNWPGSHAAWINIFNYYAFGPRDYLVSPPLDFSGINNPGLYFQHAYASRYSLADTLIVSISGDCGDTWTRLYSASLEDLETSPPAEESFAPATADDWCGAGYGVDCNILDLSAWAGQPGIRIRFETFGRFGNNIYIDNIQISNSVGVAMQGLDEGEVIIFPNPSEGIFNIMLPLRMEKVRMLVNSAQGQLMFSKDILPAEDNIRLDASNWPGGVYFASFISDGMNVTKKIVAR